MELGLYLLIIIIPVIASIFIKVSYNKYSNQDNDMKLTGYDVARLYLDNTGLNNIDIVETRGELSDHYDPKRKVVRLSTKVYHDSSIASMAIAAHECGHANQDKDGYLLMKIRSLLVPVVNLCTGLSYIIIIIGILAEAFNIILIGISLTATGLLFQLITLPVEINASNNAKKELQRLNVVSDSDISGVSNMLFAAAMTYVAGVLSSALQILRLLLVFNRRD